VVVFVRTAAGLMVSTLRNARIRGRKNLSRSYTGEAPKRTQKGEMIARQLDPTIRQEFLELIKDLCDHVPDRNLGSLEKAVRRLLAPEVKAELAAKLTQKPAAPSKEE